MTTHRINPDVVLNVHGHQIIIPAHVDPVRQALLGDLDEVDAINPLSTVELEPDCFAIAAPNTAAKRPGSAHGGVTRRTGEHRFQAHPGPGNGATVDMPGNGNNARSPAAKIGVAPFVSGKKKNRPTVRVRGGTLSTNADEAEIHLMKAGVQIYRRGSKLVRPVTEEVPAKNGSKTRTAALVEVSEAFLRDQMCRHMDWQRWDERRSKSADGEKWRDIDAPRAVAEVILARAGGWKFPAVVGITSTPTMRPDGTILSAPGYDPETGLLLFEPPEMPAIPERPTKADAQSALQLLKALISEFPFVDDASRSVALSALITPAVRAALPAAPMHAFTAPSPGTGKSYLVDVIAAIYLGTPCPVIGKGESVGELEKRLNTSLVAAHPLVSIDNVNGELGGDFICHAIERPTTDIRILGRTSHARIQNNVMLFATGNNLRLVGDVVRRSIVCTLNAGLERPELRAFKADPVARVLSQRGVYVAAALTIVRAHLLAGERFHAPLAIGSFQKWSDLVRGALIWLGCADPLHTMETARENDPELEQLKTMFSAMANQFGPGAANAQTAAGIISAAQGEGDSELNDALNGFKQKGKPIDPVQLGQWLGRYRDRVADGMRLARIRRGKRGAEWYVAVADPPGVGGV